MVFITATGPGASKLQKWELRTRSKPRTIWKVWITTTCCFPLCHWVNGLSTTTKVISSPIQIMIRFNVTVKDHAENLLTGPSAHTVFDNVSSLAGIGKTHTQVQVPVLKTELRIQLLNGRLGSYHYIPCKWSGCKPASHTCNGLCRKKTTSLHSTTR